MKHVRFNKLIPISVFFFFISVPYFSSAAEITVGRICWYTFDTILKICSSGFSSDLTYRIHELKKHDELIGEYRAYCTSQMEATSSHIQSVSEVTLGAAENITHIEYTYEVAIVESSTISKQYSGTDLIIGGTHFADQFLKSEKLFDENAHQRVMVYRSERGDCGFHSQIGTSHMRASTTAASIFNIIKAFGDWLCESDDDHVSKQQDLYVHHVEWTAEYKAAVHQQWLQRFKSDIIQKVARFNDADLQWRKEILLGWKQGQEKALKKYAVHRAHAQTLERIKQLTDATLSAERNIEIFDVELAAIDQEQKLRARNQYIFKNNQSAYVDSGCNLSPDGKDPKNKDKKERYVGKKYSNMNEIFKKEKIGKRLQECSERIEGEKFKGAQVYRVKKNMPELGLYENDVFYLDTYHGDHIEVFKGNREGTPRNILSVDGRSLPDKLKRAIQDGRTYRPFR